MTKGMISSKFIYPTTTCLCLNICYYPTNLDNSTQNHCSFNLINNGVE